MTIGLKPVRLGIDLGGTKTEIVALGPDGEELLRRRVDTPRSYAGTLDALEALVRDAESALGARGTLGVGIPGALSPATGRVKNANSTWLIGEALDADLGARLGRTVRLMNDANCFALSEASDGAAAGAACVFGVILGTGVGGGVVIQGRVHPGANLIAGEWGHNPFPVRDATELPGPLCFCGRHGCVETWLSGPGLSGDHLRVTGEHLEARDVAVRAEEGDAAAGATVDRWVARLGRALAVVTNLLDPDVVVLGGGLSNIAGLPERAHAAMAPHVFTDHVVTRVVRNAHGDSSGVRGAAWLWTEAEARSRADAP